MRWCLFVVGVCFSTSLISSSSGRAQGGGLPAADEKLIQEILACDDPLKTSEAYRQLFNNVGAAGIQRLQTDPNDSIAIQAAWEAVALTVPKEDGERAFRPDRHKLDWFLGFLEGRARVQTPKWWADVLLNAVANRRDNFYFDLPGQPTVPEMPRKSLDHDAGFDQVRAPLDTTLKRDGAKIVLRVGKDSVAIPEDLFAAHKADNGQVYCSIAALITPTRCYIAVLSKSLVCIDRSSSRVLWKSEIRCGWPGAIGGMADVWGAVTEQNNRVVVFGCYIGLYADAFRSEDGTNLFRFASFY